jgi:bifunctional DNA-binding transcriptional regulator/antitoxin component of YhaV-PrlF toxin-antitoxin module
MTIPKIITEKLGLNVGDQILYTSDEKGNVILKGPIIKIPFHVYVIDATTYGEKRLATLPVAVAKMLEIENEDRLVFVLDEKGDVILKNHNIILKTPIKKYVTNTIIIDSTTYGDRGMTTIPSTVSKMLEIEKGDQLIFILDEKGNVILKGPKINHNNIIDTTIYRENGLITITSMIASILKIEKGDQILFVLDEIRNVILKGPMIEN